MISGRALRCLCTNYVFKEVRFVLFYPFDVTPLTGYQTYQLSPDVFTHNRPSAVVDTQKPVDLVVKHAM